MKIERKKLIRIIIGAIVFAMALFVVIKIVSILTTKKVDTTEGVALIKEEESQDVEEVENKILKLEAQTKSDEKDKANRTEKQIFVNSVIMGDSIANGYLDYDVLDSSSIIAKIGVSITDIDDQIERVEQMSPDAIFLTYGMNDIENTNGDASLYKPQYKKVIDELKEKLPNSRLFVNSIFPVQQKVIDDEPAFANVTQYNEMLTQLCDEEQITFIDCTDLVEEKYYDEDGIHFVADFYPLWAAKLAEVASL